MAVACVVAIRAGGSVPVIFGTSLLPAARDSAPRAGCPQASILRRAPLSYAPQRMLLGNALLQVQRSRAFLRWLEWLGAGLL